MYENNVEIRAFNIVYFRYYSERIDKCIVYTIMRFFFIYVINIFDMGSAQSAQSVCRIPVSIQYKLSIRYTVLFIVSEILEKCA